MKIFVSHASKNEEIVLRFAEFLEAVSVEIEVFCSSEKGSIGVGRNYIEDIFEKLNVCDLFIPILSPEYYKSKFCMIELGVAYSYLYNKYKKNGQEYIFPFALFPVKKGNALSDTPMASIETGDITSESDIKTLLKYISEEKKIHIGCGMNKELHFLKSDIDRILIKEINMLEKAKVTTYFNKGNFFKREEDIINHNITNDTITINFNIDLYDEKGDLYPSYIGVALGYVDLKDLGRYLDADDAAKLRFIVKNITNSLKEITVEFKYSDDIRVLDKFNFPVANGDNILNIPLNKIRSVALEKISEICFVVHPYDLVKTKGMFQISDVKIL